MAITPALPFEQGTTWDSGSLGGVPAGTLGSIYSLADGTILQVCKNVDAAALNGSRCIRLDATAGSSLVNECSGAADVRYYGITDPVLVDKGNTIPVNAYFYAQKAGVSRVAFGYSAAAGSQLMPHATDGHVNVAATSVISGVTVNTTAFHALVGVSLTTVASGSVGRILMRPLI